MNIEPGERLVVALDLESLAQAQELVSLLGDDVLWYKVGLELFTAAGPEALQMLKRRGKKVFLDLKLHDIPTTVARAARRAADLGADLIDLHVAAGGDAMRAAVEALQDSAIPAPRPRLLGVTVLTSARALAGEAGGLLTAGRLGEEVVRRAGDAADAGLDGVVAPVAAAAGVRRRCGPDFLLLTPGIRPAGAARGDQKWIATPGEALRAGARWLVVGRPITAAAEPERAAQVILEEIREALLGERSDV